MKPNQIVPDEMPIGPGSGRTTWQIAQLPVGGLYLCSTQKLAQQAQHCAARIHRSDVHIVALDNGSYLRGKRFPALDVDHASLDAVSFTTGSRFMRLVEEARTRIY